jgi:hypothetical protein
MVEHVQRIMKDEYKLDSTAKLNQTSLYIDIVLNGILSSEQKTLGEMLKKLQGGMLTATRVALSSDVNVIYIVVTARDPGQKMYVRLIQRIQDIKAFMYQRLSKNDYDDYLVLEIETPESANDAAVQLPFENKDEKAASDEFYGRLLVSNINMLSRSNPFMGVLFNNAQLQYCGYSGNELSLKLSNVIRDPALPLFEEIVLNQSKKVVKRCAGDWGLKTIRITTPAEKSLLYTIPEPIHQVNK